MACSWPAWKRPTASVHPLITNGMCTLTGETPTLNVPSEWHKPNLNGLEPPRRNPTKLVGRCTLEQICDSLHCCNASAIDSPPQTTSISVPEGGGMICCSLCFERREAWIVSKERLVRAFAMPVAYTLGVWNFFCHDSTACGRDYIAKPINAQCG